MSSLLGQFQSPVSLSAKIDSNARSGEVVKVVVTAEMDSEWKIYALRDQGEGPIATRVTVLGDIKNWPPFIVIITGVPLTESNL